MHRRGQDADLYEQINTGPTNRTFGIAPRTGARSYEQWDALSSRSPRSRSICCTYGRTSPAGSTTREQRDLYDQHRSRLRRRSGVIDFGDCEILDAGSWSAACWALPTGSRCMVQSARLPWVRWNADIDCGLAWAPAVSGRASPTRRAAAPTRSRSSCTTRQRTPPRRGRAHHAAGGGERSLLRPQIYDAGSGPSHGVGAIRSATRTDARSERLEPFTVGSSSPCHREKGHTFIKVSDMKLQACSDIRLGRPHCRRPVFVAVNRVGAAPAAAGTPRSADSPTARTGPVLPRFSIRGRKEIACPTARSFSRSHIRCQACSPSSVTGNGCGGQGRCHVTSKRDVIEARHRDMPRHSDATFAQRTHQTHRDQIVEGQDTGCRRGQNALRGLISLGEVDSEQHLDCCVRMIIEKVAHRFEPASIRCALRRPSQVRQRPVTIAVQQIEQLLSPVR